MKGLLTALAVILSVGLGSPAFASGILDRDELFFDREDLVEELILRERLFGRPFLSPFGFSPFGFGRVGLDLFLIEELLEDRFDRDEEFDRDRFDFDRERFDFDRDRFDRFDFDRDRFDFDRDRDDRD